MNRQKEKNEKQKLKEAEEKVRFDQEQVKNQFNVIKGKLSENCEEFSREFEEFKNLVPSTLKYIDQLKKKSLITDKKRLEEELWENYFNHGGLPQNFTPSDIQQFLAKLNYENDSPLGKDFDMRLKCNENCFLTQDTDVPDISFKKLKHEQATSVGDKFASKVQKILEVINCTTKFVEMYSSRYSEKEIILLEYFLFKLRDYLNNDFDNFTGELLANVETCLHAIDSISADYKHECKIFQIKIWSQRDVPRPLNDLNENICISMDPIIQELSFKESYINSIPAIQVLHLEFDHYSMKCPTYHSKKFQYNPNNIFNNLENYLEKLNNVQQSTLTDLDN